MNVEGFSEAATKFRVFADNLDEAADGVDPAVDDATEEAAQEVQQTAQRLVPVQTGALRSSIGVTKTVPGRYSVGTDLEYGRYVEFGRGPVSTDRADALMFTGASGSAVFADNVGPAEPQPFLRPALGRNEKTLADEIRENIESLFNSIW